MSEKAQAGSVALWAKQYCDRLFPLERDFAELSPEDRCRKRQELSKPLMEGFFTWLRTQKIAKKSAFGSAALYVLGQQKYLSAYLLDGRLEISNNRAERSIKPFVMAARTSCLPTRPAEPRPALLCTA